ncbi:capsular exopolysaccharide synthesis family protein [Promicromonospora sp. AC04]|uniref:polysaccharide biosynthesis tyrosine autokinase n=1 Tax=Promicromonospora sp. AC04 TaxID=2135723 RepID=UPI000D3400EA|nr:polysaccharide biosynthesis tyrosine autokinase [Promicromonospora sp. AC04]PUB27777.1 capsular exopolysaccharide synthesis family protein [Promicromonospora sp. AC04]
MEANEYLNVLRKRWVTVVATVVAAVIAAVVILLTMTPMYRASSQVYVAVGGGTSLNEMIEGNNFTVRKVKSYAELITSPRVLEPVIESLGLDDSVTSLAGRVQAEQPAETVLITITVADSSPDLAARTADGIAESLAVVVPELERSAGDTAASVTISTVRDATVPSRPVSPNTAVVLTLGLFLGAFLGVGLAFLREMLDTKIRSQSDVQKLTDASVIGVINFDEDVAEHPLIVQESPHAPRAEAFRRLRTNLQFLEVGGGPRVFVITSALPGEGKSTTSINLAITLADAGSRVLLIDADLRRPSVSGYLGLEGSVGLTTVLIGRVRHEDAIQPWGTSNLHVLPSGQVPPNPSELLGSQSMAALLAELADAYDVVIADTAPLLPVTDGAILAKMTGGAVVVVGAGITHRPQLTEALGALDTVGARVLGVVVNRVAAVERAGYGYGGYYAYGPVDSVQGKEPARTSEDAPRRWRASGVLGGLADVVRDGVGRLSGLTATGADDDGPGPAKPDPELDDVAPDGSPVEAGSSRRSARHPFDPVHPVHKEGQTSQAGTGA